MTFFKNKKNRFHENSYERLDDEFLFWYIQNRTIWIENRKDSSFFCSLKDYNDYFADQWYFILRVKLYKHKPNEIIYFGRLAGSDNI
jgi:hypothetical protein